MIDYSGSSTLVTGAASGIGKALAKALSSRGAHVVLADLDLARTQAAAAELGGPSLALACDLADPEAPAKVIDSAYAWRGRLDLVCSNAGIGRNKRVLKEVIDADADRLFQLNLFAAIRTAQAYAAKLQANGVRGRLMITGSENSLSVPAAVKRSRLALYAATKHGVLIAAEWLREELGGEIMDLHVLIPGAVYTPLVARNLPDPAQAPPELGLIMPERCAEIALKGMDLGLFYIPTHRHIGEDIKPRAQGVWDAIEKLNL